MPKGKTSSSRSHGFDPRGSQLTFVFGTKILSEYPCTSCHAPIRTQTRAEGFIESEYSDAQGQCWNCSNERHKVKNP